MLVALVVACGIVGYLRQPWWAVLPFSFAYWVVTREYGASALGAYFYRWPDLSADMQMVAMLGQAVAFSVVAYAVGWVVRSFVPPPPATPDPRCALAGCLGAGAGVVVGAVLSYFSNGGSLLITTAEMDGALLGALLIGCFEGIDPVPTAT